MLSKDVPLDSKRAKNAPLSSDENVNIRVDLAQIEQLRRLGVLDADQAEAGRKAGGMNVSVSASLVAQFRQENPSNSDEIEKLAQRIHAAGMTTPARLFLVAGKPLSFFGAQMLLLAQPASKLLFRTQDPAGHFYRLLEDRDNVDRLLRRLDALEAAPALPKSKPDSSSRISNEKKSQEKSYNKSYDQIQKESSRL